MAGFDAKKLSERALAVVDYVENSAPREGGLELMQAVTAVFRAHEDWKLAGEPTKDDLPVALDAALTAFEEKYLQS